MKREVNIARNLEVRIDWNLDPSKPMGRFGGGWRNELGIQPGGTSLIINLWTHRVRLNWRKPT